MTASSFDDWVARARAVRIEDELRRRGIALQGNGAERVRACPRCGGFDRYGVNIKKQLWNCRGCEVGGDVIKLLMHLDGVNFVAACTTLTGESPPEPNSGKAWTFISEHVYQTAAGEPFLRVRRYLDENGKKQYPQAHWDGREWVKGKPHGAKLPYRLPQLIAAPLTATIYFCEGEKNVDALARLNFVATTASEGARAKWDPALTTHFKDRHVVVLPDADEPGRKHGQKVATAINGIAASVKVLDLYSDRDDGSDVSDWIAEDDTAGVKLAKRAKDVPLWELNADEGNSHTGSSDDILIAELAALPQLDYAKRRKDAAKRFGITVGELDKIVAGTRGEIPATTPERWRVEPWDAPVDTAELLTALLDTFNRYVILPLHGAIAMALWTMHVWTLDAAYFSPFLMFTSPEMRCGKSTALKLLYRTGPRAVFTSNISPAAIYRYVDASQPTLLIDEAETFVTGNEEVRGILNSGHSRDTAVVIRLVGDNHEPKEFSTWSAKAIASIGKLAGTLRDRSIILPMKRKKSGERVSKLRGRDTEEFLELRRKAKRWADDNVEALREAHPSIPEGLNDRATDNWELLFAIADLAGRQWSTAARTAALQLSADSEAEAPSVRLSLLADIRDVFDEIASDRLPSETLVAELTKEADGPWIAHGRGSKPITQRQVATLLSDFMTSSGAKIKPRNLRTDDKVKRGYYRDDFADAFERYLSSVSTIPPVQVATTLHANDLSDLDKKTSATSDFAVADDVDPNPLKPNVCSGVADQSPLLGEGEDRTCAQCGGQVDGNERRCWIDGRSVWLHPECDRFYLKAQDDLQC